MYYMSLVDNGGYTVIYITDDCSSFSLPPSHGSVQHYSAITHKHIGGSLMGVLSGVF